MNWTEQLKVGDEVALEASQGFSRQRLMRYRVERVTPTQLVVDGTRFRRTDGREIGATGYHSDYLREMTGEMKRKVIRAENIAALEAIKWHTTEDAIISATLAAYNAAKSKRKEASR